MAHDLAGAVFPAQGLDQPVQDRLSVGDITWLASTFPPRRRIGEVHHARGTGILTGQHGQVAKHVLPVICVEFGCKEPVAKFVALRLIHRHLPGWDD